MPKVAIEDLCPQLIHADRRDRVCQLQIGVRRSRLTVASMKGVITLPFSIVSTQCSPRAIEPVRLKRTATRADGLFSDLPRACSPAVRLVHDLSLRTRRQPRSPLPFLGTY